MFRVRWAMLLLAHEAGHVCIGVESDTRYASDARRPLPRRPPLPWIVAFCEECACRFTRFTPQHFACALAALAAWRLEPGSAFVQQLLAALGRRLASFNTQQLVDVLRSLERLGWAVGTRAAGSACACGAGSSGSSGQQHASTSGRDSAGGSSVGCCSGGERPAAQQCPRAAVPMPAPLSLAAVRDPAHSLPGNGSVVCSSGSSRPRPLRVSTQRLASAAAARQQQRAASLARGIDLDCLAASHAGDNDAAPRAPPCDNSGQAAAASERLAFAAAFMQTFTRKLRYVSLEELDGVLELAPRVFAVDAPSEPALATGAAAMASPHQAPSHNRQHARRRQRLQSALAFLAKWRAEFVRRSGA